MSRGFRRVHECADCVVWGDYDGETVVFYIPEGYGYWSYMDTTGQAVAGVSKGPFMSYRAAFVNAAARVDGLSLDHDDAPTEPDIVFAFKPRSIRQDGVFDQVSLYDRSAETNPYDVPGSDEKIRAAIDLLPKPMAEHDGDGWVKYDYQMLLHGDSAAARIDSDD